MKINSIYNMSYEVFKLFKHSIKLEKLLLLCLFTYVAIVFMYLLPCYYTELDIISYIINISNYVTNSIKEILIEGSKVKYARCSSFTESINWNYNVKFTLETLELKNKFYMNEGNLEYPIGTYKDRTDTSTFYSRSLALVKEVENKLEVIRIFNHIR